MKVMPDGSLPRFSVGLSAIGVAVLTAIVMFLGAKESASPILYIIILGGLFVGVPGALGIGVVYEHLRRRAKHVQRKSGTHK
jgi:hypothetical protein